MTKVGFSYGDLESMPMEYIEWFYRKKQDEEHRQEQGQ